jgi:hypothetical protein
MQHATAGTFLGISGVVWFWLVSIIGIGGVAYSLNRRLQVLLLGRSEDRFDRIGERFKHLLVYAIGQRRMFDDLFAGFYHLLIFYGFLVVSLRTVLMVIEGLFPSLELPLLHTAVGHAYLFSKDLVEVAVLVGLVLAALRRTVLRKERVVQSFGAWLVLILIAILMITDLGAEGARIAAGATEATYLPVSALVAKLFAGMSAAGLQTLYTVLWWIHLITLYYFANELPYSKHFQRVLHQARPARQAGHHGPRGHRRGNPLRRCLGDRFQLEAAARPVHLHRVRSLPGVLSHHPHQQAPAAGAVHQGRARSGLPRAEGAARRP